MTILSTCGDINGIGPEVLIKALDEYIKSDRSTDHIVIIPKNVFTHYYEQTGADFRYILTDRILPLATPQKQVTVFTLPGAAMNFGGGTLKSGKTAFLALEMARGLIMQNTVDALVTAPVSKAAIALSQPSFNGHTDYLASWVNTKKHCMMFHSPTMIGALLTIHVPLSDVGKLLSLSGVVEKLRIVAKTLRNDFGIVKPKIAVLGLNPHAGENGLIGMEDLHVLKKAIDKRAFIKGPFPADAYFGLHKYKEFHCTVACYHDQLLIPFKMLSMSDGVNVTAGLPFVRTSPDHGTGFDIAGKNRADHRSMLNAFRLAYRIAENRSR